MKKLLAAIALTVAYVGAFEDPAHGATFKPIAGGHSLVMTGDVEEGDGDRLLTAYFTSAQVRGFAPERIFLNSDGGSVEAGLRVAMFVEQLGLHTVVGATDECLSICATIFATGVHRVAFPSSVIGVHSAWEERADGKGSIEPVENDGTSAITLYLARHMAAYGAPDSIIVKLITTAPGDMSMVSLDELRAWAEIIE